ncbi:uncharacterized membrane protein C20F10.07 isoform X2 [Nematostella vectensis]|uniref:uncharacterized membrane protein C20F10.07 isoform X2 n=1 Tax=Nematostella vectensis TaxID=45351 RepID=UPI0013906BFF|nr:uncharacterized membrane protein C20F10.07 isoform X2 [Nematostella vectensis]
MKSAISAVKILHKKKIKGCRVVEERAIYPLPGFTPMNGPEENETSSLSSFVQEFETFAEEVKDGIPEVDSRGRINHRKESEELDSSTTESRHVHREPKVDLQPLCGAFAPPAPPWIRAWIYCNFQKSSKSASYNAISENLSLRSDKQVSFIKALLTPRTPYEEFHRLFKDVPKDQFPINDFSCALSREILLQGRIYISQDWVCFYSNIFGWETQVTIDCRKVLSITREKTAYVVPNAILITTEDDKHFFSSFLSRETVFKLLLQVWEEKLKQSSGKIPPNSSHADFKECLGGEMDTVLQEGVEEGEECAAAECISQSADLPERVLEYSPNGDSGIFDCQSGFIATEGASSAELTTSVRATGSPLAESELPADSISPRLSPYDPANVAIFIASIAEMLFSYCQVSFRLIKKLSREQLFALLTTILMVLLLSCSAFLLYRLSVLEPRLLAPPPPPVKAYLHQSIQQIIKLRKQVHEAEVSRVRSIVSANLEAISQIRETLEMLQEDLTNRMAENCTVLSNNSTVCIRV